MVLWIGCFTGWLMIVTHREVDVRLWTDCKLFYFLYYFGRGYSSSLLVLMSVEKCFAIYFPLKSRTICTVKTAKWLTSIVGVILMAFNTVYFFAYKSKFSNSFGRVTCVYSFDDQVLNYLNVVNSILYSFGPFVIMLLTNFAIVFKFMAAKCGSNSTESTNQALAKSATRGTAMVVTVSVTFIILTAPTAVNQALLHVIKLRDNPYFFIFMICTQYLNHSINGVLYCIVGTRFRKEFLKIFCRKKRPPEPLDPAQKPMDHLPPFDLSLPQTLKHLTPLWHESYSQVLDHLTLSDLSPTSKTLDHLIPDSVKESDTPLKHPLPLNVHSGFSR